MRIAAEKAKRKAELGSEAEDEEKEAEITTPKPEAIAGVAEGEGETVMDEIQRNYRRQLAQLAQDEADSDDEY